MTTIELRAEQVGIRRSGVLAADPDVHLVAWDHPNGSPAVWRTRGQWWWAPPGDSSTPAASESEAIETLVSYLEPPPLAKQVREILEEENPEARLMDGFDEALIGVARRCGQPTLAVYDYDKCIDILSREMSEDDAVEYFEFNCAGAWVGPHTPVILQRPSEA